MNNKYNWPRPKWNTHLNLGKCTIHLFITKHKSHSLQLSAGGRGRGGSGVSVGVFYKENGEN